jgi:hypothetical protein
MTAWLLRPALHCPLLQHVPDKNGNTLPPDLTSGSYEIRDLTNKGIGTLFEGKIVYDKTYGHVAYGCGGCCGFYNIFVWFNPLGVPLSLTANQGVDAYNTCSVGAMDVSDSFYNWSTANTTIATVDYYGTHTGHAVGSTTCNTSGQLESPNNHLGCPLKTLTPGWRVART